MHQLVGCSVHLFAFTVNAFFAYIRIDIFEKRN